MKLGSSDIAALKLGTADVAKLYRGSTEVWAAEEPFDPATEPSLLAWYSGDNTGNTTLVVDVDFSPSDVNTSTNRITMTLPAGFTRTSPYEAMLCRFTTTGTLPAPLAVDTDYVFEDMGDGTVRLFPVMTNADYALIPSYIAGETLHPLQAYACQAAVINLTDQGSGVHTLITEPILTQITDKTANGINFTPRSGAKSAFRLITDENGFKYIEKPGALGRSDNNDDAYGKLMDDAIDNTTLGNLWNGKRYMYYVGLARMKFNVHLSMARAFLTPSKVNAATGVFSANVHGFATAQRIEHGVLSDGGAFPTPSVAFAADVYVRSVNSNSFTLHPTATDATNNTNKYTFNDTGSGVFYVLDPTRVQGEACSRQLLYDICCDNNGHDFVPSTNVYGRDLDCTSSFFLTGGNNGLLNQTFRTLSVGRNWDILKVRILVPSGTVAPICNDTGARLTSGEYWVTAGGSDNCRLHRLEKQAEALASVGVSVGSLTNDQVIKYDLTGASGKIQIHAAENAMFRQFDDSFVVPSTIPLITFGQYGIWVAIQDYVDDKYYNGFNAPNNILDGHAHTLTSKTLFSSSASNINNGNADEPHVPAFANAYEEFIGVTDSDPVTIVNKFITLLTDKYGSSF